MAIKTITEQLEEVQAAISTLLSADWQRMDVDQREVERHRLDWLEKREERLLALYKEEQSTGTTNSGIRVRGVEVDI